MTKRFKVVTVTGAISAICVVGFMIAERSYLMMGVGFYKLKVEIRSKARWPICKVQCAPCYDDISAGRQPEEGLQASISIDRLYFEATIEDYDGAPFEVSIKFTTLSSNLTGRSFGGSQLNFVNVVATYADESRVLRVFEIPDRHKSTSMIIEMP